MTRTISEAERVELNALVDGELDDPSAEALKQRIVADPMLAAAKESILATREALGRVAMPMSTDFARRVEWMVDTQASSLAGAVPGRYRFSGWQNIAAAVVVTAFLASGSTYLLIAPHGTSLDELIASGHRRSLLAESPVDVLSSDRHTVKPWLDARLGVSPPAPDLAAQGYPLFGGRVEVLGQQPVPALVYRHNEHVITVVAVPSNAGSMTPADLSSGGFNMVLWRADGFEFHAVSDLEVGELNAFVHSYEVAAAPNGG